MKRKILIMGLPGSGKTTLAEILVKKLKAAWFNADAVRQDIYSELGFSPQDRLSHATRMGKLCDWAKMGGSYVIADFVCPTQETRQAFNADFTIWVDRIQEGRYEDTNKMFEAPKNADVTLGEGSADEWAKIVINKLNSSESWDNQAPTALLIGRYQPFHVGHKTLVAEALKRTGQCCIALRDVGGIDDSNPYDFQKVKKEIESACIEFGDKIKVVELPNIMDVFYGRGVGYNIEQLELSKELQEVSATKIRDGQIGQDGKPLGKRPK
jgi:hypothetical protein|tara:strand:+ start:7582 stop:8385 length:804 start_codon:yes stop_codon:yes gene_type:complete